MHQLNRHAHRVDDKLQHIKKQANVRGEDTQTSIEELHKQLVDAESFRLNVSFLKYVLLF